MPKIYTRTGDGGETGTFRGRVRKSDQLAVAIGSIDEVNSWMGLVRYQLSNTSPLLLSKILEREIRRVQTNLFIIGAILAGSKKYRFNDAETKKLEKLIDNLELQLPKINNFVYPTGYLQVARSIARRAEREVVALGIVNKNILKYLNRLSDALFVMARWVNRQLKIKEDIWRT